MYSFAFSAPQQAEKSLRFYKGCTSDSAEDEQRFAYELAKLKAYALEREDATDNEVRWRDYCTPEARRGLAIGVTMMSLNIFTGGLLMLNYAATIFKDSGSELDPNTSSIILIAVQLLGTNIASFLVDRIGRRALMIASTTGTGTGMCAMATFNFLHSRGVDLTEFNWVPVASLSVAVFMASMGLLPLVFVVVAEVLPPKVRADFEYGSLRVAHIF